MEDGGKVVRKNSYVYIHERVNDNENWRQRGLITMGRWKAMVRSTGNIG